MRIARFAAGMMVILMAGGAFVSLAQAADPTPPEVIQNLQQDGATLKYLGDDLGYQGWLAEQKGDAQYFYVSPDGRAIFLGIMFKPDGQAVTFEQLKKVLKKDQSKDASAAAAPKATSPGETFLAAATAARGFEMGVKTAPLMHVFIDPRCPHCKDMMTALWPAIDAGKVRVKVIPIGAVARDSQALAAYLLQAPDAPVRLKKLMLGEKDAIPTDTGAPEGPVMDNTKLLLDRKLNAVPVTVYRAKDGTVKLIQGPPEDVAAVLADLTI